MLRNKIQPDTEMKLYKVMVILVLIYASEIYMMTFIIK